MLDRLARETEVRVCELRDMRNAVNAVNVRQDAVESEIRGDSRAKRGQADGQDWNLMRMDRRWRRARRKKLQVDGIRIIYV